MSDSKKTGLFWLAALVVFGIGMYAGWPTPTRDRPLQGTTLFEKFTDPLAAADLKVVTFDEAAGELEEFVVRKNSENIWTIASKSDYPADALDQVTKAANALIGLKALDVQTTDPEDHAELGVLEPDVRKLQVGDEGVGRLVTFRDRDRGELASVIIGDSVKGEEDKRYVRRPGQDPVYVVKFDPSSVTTRFADWIEEDLLQLSSIEIDRVLVEDYEAQLGGPQRFSLRRNYLYEVQQDDTGWQLQRLAEYAEGDLSGDPTPVEIGDDQTLDTAKLNEMKNALDDLKFVDAFRKPKGVGATLQADAELVKDDETVRSLISRGFYPVSFGDSDRVELLSANGEMQVSTKDGVRYTLRFGNIASAGGDEAPNSDDVEGDAAIDREGVNRFLLVTTSVDESQFPAPDARPIPASVEELKAQRRAAAETSNDAQDDASPSEPPGPEVQPPSDDEAEVDSTSKPDGDPEAAGDATDAEASANADEVDEIEEIEPSDANASSEAGTTAQDTADEDTADDDAADEDPADDDTAGRDDEEGTAAGAATATGSGAGQAEADGQASDSEAADSEATESEDPDSNASNE